MRITSVRVNKELEPHPPSRDGTRLLAFVSITLDWAIVVSHIRVVESRDGKKIVCMPSRVTSSGHYRDVVYPIVEDMRASINKAVLDKLSEVSNGNGEAHA